MVTTYRLNKPEWKWVTIEKDIFILGTGGLATISSSPKEVTQLENYPAARFQHFTH